MRFVPASSLGPDALAEVWNGCLPEKYRVDGGLISRLGREHPCYWEEHSWAVLDGERPVGFVEVKASPLELYPGPSADTVYLHSLAFLTEAAGSALVLRVMGAFADRRIVFGGDHGHFWPGVPEEWEAGFRVLRESGFVEEEGWAHDLERDLAGFDYPEALRPLGDEGVSLRRGGKGDEAGLDRFLRDEFPGRWRYDVLNKFATEPGDVFLLWVEGAVEGFAFTQSEATTTHPVAGCVWRADLGPGWGGLGPIGVSENVRGRGFGGAVLVGALSGLRDAGVRRCVIDWTSLVDFYGKYGFEVTRRYQAMSLPV